MAFIAAAAASVVAGGVGAYLEAKEQKKAIKAKRDADLKVLEAEKKASLESIQADTQAQSLIIESEARARIKSALYEADTEAQNIGIARLLSRDALNRGLLDEFSFRQQASQAQGAQRAELGGTGVDVNSGSAAFLQEELIVATDMDALAIRQEASREAFGFEIEAYGAGRRQQLSMLEATSTEEVSAANISGLKKTSQIRQKGIRETAKVNARAIRDTAAAASPSPFQSAGLALLSQGTNYASSWYLSQDR